MSPIKLSEIISYSSEDPNHVVDNLLKQDHFRRWKCKSETNDKQAYVIIKLDKLVHITGLDIGNEQSAFVEVLVGREGVDFQVLLVASSFMSPIESRNSTETRRVRMFGKDKLNKTTMDQKWDRIKVICTQPFNKKIQYGLSFINIVGEEDTKSPEPNAVQQVKLGSFVLSESDEHENEFAAGSLFAKRKEPEQVKANVPNVDRAPTPPKAVKRKADTEANAPDEGFYQLNKTSKVKKTDKESKTNTKPSNDNTSKSDIKENKPSKIDAKDRGHTSTPKIEKHSNTSSSKEEKHSNTPSSKVLKPSSREEKYSNTQSSKDDKHSNPPSSKVERPSSREEKQSNTPSSKDKKPRKPRREHKPFKQLMKDVVFVMSGYQNPQRSDLRDKLVEMGATYKNDWEDNTCTHLICAFSNTPKYNAVKGKGKIVTGKWIEKCHKEKKRIPWRRYNLERNRNADESEEEIWATEILPKDDDNERISDKSDKQTSQQGNDKRKSEEMDSYEGLTDASDEQDTDDELQRVMNKKAKTTDTHSKDNISPSTKNHSEVNGTPKTSTNHDSESEYDADTDVEEDTKDNIIDVSQFRLPDLPNIFEKSNFFVYGDMPVLECKEVCRYIVAFKGKMHNYMDAKVNFVITDAMWDKNFDDALSANPSVQFVKPAWIWKCSDKQKFVRPQQFLVLPPDVDSD